MHKKNTFSLFFTLLFALCCVSNASAPQGRELLTTRKGSSTFKFYHAMKLTNDQDKKTAPTHHVITLNDEEFAQFSKDFSKHRSQKWTRSQSAPYINQVVKILKSGISTNILLQLPKQNPSVYIEIDFDLKHDAKLNTTSPQITVQLTTTTIALNAAVLNFFKSIILPDGFFTRNGSKMSAIAVVAGIFAFKNAHKDAFAKRSTIYRINEFRIDLATSLAKKFAIDSSEVFEAQADKVSLRPNLSSPIDFSCKLQSIPMDKKLIVISCSTEEAFTPDWKYRLTCLNKMLNMDKYLEQIKILIIPIKYSYHIDTDAAQNICRYGWQIIFVNDTDDEISPTDKLPRFC